MLFRSRLRVSSPSVSPRNQSRALSLFQHPSASHRQQTSEHHKCGVTDRNTHNIGIGRRCRSVGGGTTTLTVPPPFPLYTLYRAGHSLSLPFANTRPYAVQHRAFLGFPRGGSASYPQISVTVWKLGKCQPTATKRTSTAGG